MKEEVEGEHTGELKVCHRVIMGRAGDRSSGIGGEERGNTISSNSMPIGMKGTGDRHVQNSSKGVMEQGSQGIGQVNRRDPSRDSRAGIQDSIEHPDREEVRTSEGQCLNQDSMSPGIGRGKLFRCAGLVLHLFHLKEPSQ